MRISTSLILAALFAGSACADTILYDNLNPPSVDTFTDLTFSSGPYDGIGDSVTVTAPGVVSNALIQLYNDGAASTFFDASLSSVHRRFAGRHPDRRHVYADRHYRRCKLLRESGLRQSRRGRSRQRGADPRSGQCDRWRGPRPGTVFRYRCRVKLPADTAIVLQGSSFSQISTGGDGSGNPAFQLTSADSVPEPACRPADFWIRRRCCSIRGGPLGGIDHQSLHRSLARSRFNPSCARRAAIIAESDSSADAGDVSPCSHSVQTGNSFRPVWSSTEDPR